MTVSKRGDRSVAAWFEEHSDHPDLPVLLALCDRIDRVDPRLICEIKWNAPSYAIVDHFATTGLVPKGGVRLVLHCGAVKRETPLRLRGGIPDTSGLLDWRGHDRATATFRTVAEVDVAGEALEAIIGEWILLTQT
ncbi:DUF1801 domain-containing protein [Leucobacter ruminantium]|uniref:DUF1801 domain-containing protein n=1 Tax=Leucobacter ruminantium TaxID=1289170 RepID=A0A939LVT6_9MICO|nr:DUF1801 domain-containing protein [Leucobacter ruminantium]